ncbi:MAG: hypothetical protein ACQESF_04135 [Nanobdellota archaeon]
MTNNKKKEGKKEGFFESLLKDRSTHFIYDASRKFFETMFKTIRVNIESTIKLISRYLGSYIFFLVGVLFILVSVILLLEEYFNVHHGWSLLVIGLILLVVSLMMRLNIEKNKR